MTKLLSQLDCSARSTDMTHSNYSVSKHLQIKGELYSERCFCLDQISCCCQIPLCYSEK